MGADIDRRQALAGFAAVLLPLSCGGARGQIAQPSRPPTDGDREVILRATPVRAKVVPATEQEADLWLFNADAAGPVVRIRHGEELRVRLRNDTPKPLSLHWHGVRGKAADDGVGGLSQPAIPPGGSYAWRFTPPDAGTFLIRPIVLGGGSGEAAGRGLGGILVVDEREPPRVDAEFALLVRDWLLEPNGALAPFGRTEEAAFGGRLGNRLTAGGHDAPKRIEAPAGSRIRLRIVNASNARVMRIRFDGAKAYVGAVDGQPTDTFEPLRSTLPFAPGSRYDIFVDAPREPGAVNRIVALVGPGVPLVEIAASAEPAVERPAIAALPPNPLLPPGIALQNAVRPTVAITGGASRNEAGQVGFAGDPKSIWKLNGASGSTGSPPLFRAARGQPVVLTLVNRTAFLQTIHVHGHMFRLLHALDDGWEPYWLDTLQLTEGKTALISFPAGEPGRWLIGSTILERLDTGLWTWFEVM